MAKVHILMATYNGENFIREQIDSFLAQTYADWKLFISDDCSTDRTLDILQEYVHRYPEKIEILNSSKKMGGAKENFSYLFNVVPIADYYMFADQDDVWVADKVQKFIACFENQIEITTPGIVYCDLFVARQNLDIINESFMDYQKFVAKTHDRYNVLTENFVPGCVMMYNHCLREKVVSIPKKCIMHDWWLVLYAMYFGKMVYINESLNYYRQHENNVVGALKKQSLKDEILNVLKGLLKAPIYKIKNMIRYIKNLLDDIMVQTKQFLDSFYDTLSEDDKNHIQNCLKLRCNKNRVVALILFWKYFRFTSTFKNLCSSIVILFL